MTLEEMRRQRAELDKQIKDIEGRAIQCGSVKLKQENWKRVSINDWILSIQYVDEVTDNNNKFRSVARLHERQDAVRHIDRIISDLTKLKEALDGADN